jgi:hypothetical protein
MLRPRVGDIITYYNPKKQEMKSAKVVQIHLADRPMPFEDVLKWYQPTPKFDKLIPSWERPSREDRIICERPNGNFVRFSLNNFNPRSRYFCAEVVAEAAPAA